MRGLNMGKSGSVKGERVKEGEIGGHVMGGTKGIAKGGVKVEGL